MNPAEQSRTEPPPAPVPVPVRVWCEACPDGSRFWMEQLPACGTDYGATPFVALSEPAFASLVALLAEFRDRLKFDQRLGDWVLRSEVGDNLYTEDPIAQIAAALRGLRGEAGGGA